MYFQFRPANISDLNFISSQILAGSRKKHFAIDTESKEAVKKLKQHMHAGLSTNRFLNGTQTSTMLYTDEAGKRAGFLMIIDKLNDPHGIEIYSVAVTADYQGKGLGTLMLDNCLQQLYKYNIYARCAPESHKMRHLLIKRGFEAIESSESGDVLYKKSAPDEQISPGFLFQAS